MSINKIPHRLYLTEDQMPKRWFNLRSAMPQQPDPLLDPGTLRPLTVPDLAPIFCEELARQELDGTTEYLDIPEPIQEVYRMFRPSPLIRAYALETSPPRRARASGAPPWPRRAPTSALPAMCSWSSVLTSRSPSARR